MAGSGPAMTSFSWIGTAINIARFGNHELLGTFPIQRSDPVPSCFKSFSALNPIGPANTKTMGGEFDTNHFRHKDRSMPTTLALRNTIPAAVKAPEISRRTTPQTKGSDRSLEGILIFSGLGLGLIVLATVFSVLQLPPPVFF
jgi:hypothetical protein